MNCLFKLFMDTTTPTVIVATSPVEQFLPQISIQQSTIDLIAGFEAFRSHVYLDTSGIPTIGYGAIYLLDGSRVTLQTPSISQIDAMALLRKEIIPFANAVTRAIKVKINQNQFDACCSLAYNVGAGGFAASTVVRECNLGDFPKAADAFLLWDKDNHGNVVQGLLNRRQKERNLFLTASIV
jgi:lysozyme